MARALEAKDLWVPIVVHGTTNAVYGTTNTDEGVGIGMLKGIQKFGWKDNELAGKAIN